MNRDVLKSIAGTTALVLFLWFVFTGLADQAISQRRLHPATYWKSPLFVHDLPKEQRLHLSDPWFWTLLKQSTGNEPHVRLIVDSVEFDDSSPEEFRAMFLVIPDRKDGVPAYEYFVGPEKDPGFYVAQLQAMVMELADRMKFEREIDLVLGPWVRYQLGEGLCPEPVERERWATPAGPRTTWITLEEALEILEDLQRRKVRFDTLVFTLKDARLLQDRRTDPWSTIYRVAIEVVGHDGSDESVLAQFHYDIPHQVDYDSRNGQPDFHALARFSLLDALSDLGILHDCAEGLCFRSILASVVTGEFGDVWEEAMPSSRLDLPIIYPEECYVES